MYTHFNCLNLVMNVTVDSIFFGTEKRMNEFHAEAIILKIEIL